jgi:hypothetical protein
MSDNIVKIDFSRRIVRDAALPPVGSRDKAGLSETCRNGLLRAERNEVWLRADAVRDYWKARLAMEGVISRVKHLPEGNNHPPHDPGARWTLLAIGVKPSSSSCSRRRQPPLR